MATVKSDQRNPLILNDEEILLTEHDVSAILRVALGTFRVNRSQHPERVPPWVRLPGSRQIRWRLRDVRAFIESGAIEGERERARMEEMRREGLYPFPKSVRKKGRPTKREQMEREKEGSG